MKRVWYICGIATMTLGVTPVIAVPVVPNFSQGSMSSHTETTSTVVETINSMDYATGWQYSISGTNISHDGTTLSPGTATGSSNTINGVTSQWQNLDHSNKPNYTITTPGAAFQFTETYKSPGLTNHTIIQRETTIQSVTDTQSIFQQ
tara:strand:- start:22419 stop:22862 length:444 start_codon:yes stop_codon:yes gene_type:complete